MEPLEIGILFLAIGFNLCIIAVAFAYRLGNSSVAMCTGTSISRYVSRFFQPSAVVRTSQANSFQINVALER